MKFSYAYYIFILLACFGCTKEKKEDKIVSVTNDYLISFNDETMMKNLREKVINKGDTTAFKKLEVIYTLSGHQKEFLYYALRMAEDFKYPKAYYSVYFTMGMDIIENEGDYKKLPTYYLLKASELGYEDAIYDVKDLYPNGNIPTSKQYWNELR